MPFHQSVIQIVFAFSLLTYYLVPVLAGSNNRTVCCLTALTDPQMHPFNFQEWNAIVRSNSSIPELRLPTPDNAAWNSKVRRWKNYSTRRPEYIDFRCEARYSKIGGVESPAAQAISVTLEWCLKTPQCNGYQLYTPWGVDRWAGPVVGFLLPAVVFSICIPRGWRLSLPPLTLPRRFSGNNWYFHPLKGFVVAINLLVVFIVGTMELTRWVSVILIYAGPMLVGGLYKMLLDHHLLRRLQSLKPEPGERGNATDEIQRRKILITILLGGVIDAEDVKYSGDRDDSGDLYGNCKKFIVNTSAAQAKTRLNCLLHSQVAFGMAVGAPVAFYICAYAYGIFDAYSKLGDRATAVSLTLGLWYSIFVLVAMVFGCSLGCNNLDVIENIVSDKPRTPRRYKLVSIWRRGLSVRQWANRLGCEEDVPSMLWVSGLGVISTILVSVPCFLAFYVSLHMGNNVVGCRSSCFILYWTSQVVLIGCISCVNGSVDNWLIRFVRRIVEGVALFMSFLSTIGGTVLNTTGLSRNCRCFAGLGSITRPFNESWINLADDTLLMRQLARNGWIYTGITGLAFLGIICVCTWWYQRYVKQHCASQINAIGDLPPPECERFTLTISMADPKIGFAQYIRDSDKRSANEGIYLGPERFAAHFLLINVTRQGLENRHLAMERNPMNEDEGQEIRYIHVRRDVQGNPIQALQVAWSDRPDVSPTGNFVFRGSVLTWIAEFRGRKRVMGGFLLRKKDPRIFLNMEAYGMDPPASGDEPWTHFTLHKSP